MEKHLINEKYKSPRGSRFRFRIAQEEDMDSLNELYFKVYSGNYTLPEITDSDKMKWAIHDPNYVWLLVEQNRKLIGSVLFVMNRDHRLGKALAGVVLPEYRGHKLMKALMRRGLDYVLFEKNYIDVVYGIVRTFVTTTFHNDLKDLGFRDMGIFPNVRKVSRYETHGLKVLFKPSALKARRKTPKLIPQADEIYQIVRKRLSLEKADVEDYNYNSPREFEKFSLNMKKSKEVEWEYYKERDKGNLQMSFHPFHYPEILLYTGNNHDRAYIHFEERDGHGDLMGLCVKNNKKLTDILNGISEYAESLGIKYLEVLVDANDTEVQKKVFEADFIPCAYFPAMKIGSKGQRLDFITMCRNFVPLNFKEMKLTADTREYVRAYFKLWTNKLWKDLEHA